MLSELLPSPELHEDWRSFARALINSLDSLANNSLTGGDVTYIVNQTPIQPGQLPAFPAGIQPIWLNTGDANLYLGNPQYDPPTAPDIVYIDTQKLAEAAVNINKLADGAVSSAKILNATIASADIGNAQIISALIADASIVQAKISDLAVNEAKIANAAVTSAKIANLAVGTAHIQAAAIGTAHIQDAAIVNAKIGNTIESAGWNPTTKQGWSIDKNGLIQGSGLAIYDTAGNLVFGSGGTIAWSKITGAYLGDNLVNNGDFMPPLATIDISAGITSHVGLAGEPARYLSANAAGEVVEFNANLDPTGLGEKIFTVIPGELLFVSASIYTPTTGFNGWVPSLIFYNAAGTQLGPTGTFVDGNSGGYSAFYNLTVASQWLGKWIAIRVPTNAAYVRVYATSVGTAPVRIANFRVGRAQLGATFGAPANTPVANIPAQQIATLADNLIVNGEMVPPRDTYVLPANHSFVAGIAGEPAFALEALAVASGLDVTVNKGIDPAGTTVDGAMPVKAGEKLFISADIQGSGTATDAWTVWATFYSATFGFIGNQQLASLAAGTTSTLPIRKKAEFTVPANAAFAVFFLRSFVPGTYARIANLRVARTENAATLGATIDTNLFGQFTSGNIGTYIQAAAIGAALIGNLAVGTAHIADGAIVNAKIADATILSAKIANLVIDKITAGTLNAEIDMGTGLIRFTIGGNQLTIGKGFGTSSQFIMWFGPSMAENLMTEATAVFYLKTNGDAYFGGALLAGTLVNGATSSSISTTASSETGNFGSNGNSREYTVGYTYHESGTWNSGTLTITGTPSVTVVLEKWNGASWTQLGSSHTYNGSSSAIQPQGGDPGSYQADNSGGFSFTDNTGGLGPHNVRARITSRTDVGLSGVSLNAPGVIRTQRLSIQSVEQ
jgi:hypothetical protein